MMMVLCPQLVYCAVLQHRGQQTDCTLDRLHMPAPCTSVASAAAAASTTTVNSRTRIMLQAGTAQGEHSDGSTGSHKA